MKFIQKIKSYFPQLEQIPDSLLEPRGGYDRVVVSQRNGYRSLAILVPSEKFAEVVAFLNPSLVLEEDIDIIVSKSSRVLLDLESVTDSGDFRFYIFWTDVDINFLIKNWPMPVDGENGYNKDTHAHPEGVGFLVDKTTGTITHYKYYIYEQNANLVHNYRFSRKGKFVDRWSETFNRNADSQTLEEFGLSSMNINGVEYIRTERSDLTRQYLTIMDTLNKESD